MDVREYEAAGNRHIGLNFDKGPQPRHRTVARLAVNCLHNEGSILDIGCGRGDILRIVRQLQPTAQISIADAYEVCLAGTEKRVGPIVGRYLIDENDFDLAQIGDATFDVIVMSHVLEHLRRPIDGATAAFSLLKPGGRLIVAVPNLARPAAFLASTFGITIVNKGHVCGWDRAHWKNFWEHILKFDQVSYYGDTADLFPGPIGGIVRRTIGLPLARLVPGWSASLIAVVTKRREDRRNRPRGFR